MAENFNYQSAEGVQKWLSLKLEGKRLKEQLASNAREMKELEEAHPKEIAALKGILRSKKEKPALESEKVPFTSPNPSTMDLDETAQEESSSTTSERTTKNSPSKRPLQTILKESEKKRAKKKGRTDPVATPSGVFHPSSHSAPPPSTVESLIVNKKD